jgi:predicted dienelactone hydrolase
MLAFGANEEDPVRKFTCATALAAVLIVGTAGQASAQVAGVGHRVETLPVVGSAQQETRKVKVHLWYPAEQAAFATAAKTVYRSGLYGRTLIPELWDPLSWQIESPLARETAAIAQQGKPFPVIVFSHGSVNDPIDYAWTLEQIARAGFVVAAPYHVNNTQDDVRIDFINSQAAAQGKPALFACDDGRPSPCSRPDNARSIDDRVRDISAILDALPSWFGARVDAAQAGVMGHSRGTITALAAAGGSSAWGFGPERRVQAIMGMAIGAAALKNAVNLANITVPTVLVAGGLDRNTPQVISEEAYAAIPSVDKRFVAIPNATHRSFDSTYCAQLQSAAGIAQANPRAILDQYSVPLIASSAPAFLSGKAVHYCASSYFTSPVDIRPLVASTPQSEFPPTVGGTSVCSTTSVPCTGLETEAVKEQMTALAVEFFTSRLARAAGGTVGGTVPATLSLTLGVPVSFGPFTPGVARDYPASTTATVVSTAGDATLSVADPGAVPGHLVNGTFSLPQALQARATRTGSTATTFAAVGSPASPLSLLTWSAPVSNDPVALEFKQAIGMNDALRTGTYSKTLTFTLATSTP